jgi:hypothetical protein
MRPDEGYVEPVENVAQMAETPGAYRALVVIAGPAECDLRSELKQTETEAKTPHSDLV